MHLLAIKNYFPRTPLMNYCFVTQSNDHSKSIPLDVCVRRERSLANRLFHWTPSLKTRFIEDDCSFNIFRFIKRSWNGKEFSQSFRKEQQFNAWWSSHTRITKIPNFLHSLSSWTIIIFIITETLRNKISSDSHLITCSSFTCWVILFIFLSSQ